MFSMVLMLLSRNLRAMKDDLLMKVNDTLIGVSIGF